MIYSATFSWNFGGGLRGCSGLFVEKLGKLLVEKQRKIIKKNGETYKENVSEIWGSLNSGEIDFVVVSPEYLRRNPKPTYHLLIDESNNENEDEIRLN